MPRLTDQSGRLRQVAQTWNNVNALPEVAALQARRDKHGRSLRGEHNRARDLLNRRIWPLAAVFVGSILLAFFIAWGRPFLSGKPFRTWTFTLDLQATTRWPCRRHS